MVSAGNIPTVDVMAANIVALMRECMQADPRYIYDGTRWYDVARADCLAIADETGYSVEQVAHCVSILSPQKAWSDNIRDARACAIAARDHGTVTREIVDRLLGMGMFAQHRQVAECETVLLREIGITGPKRTCFVHNIMHPEDAHIVTVDSHACCIAIDNRDDKGTFPVSRYPQFVAAYSRASEVLNIAPMHVQAITWLYWRATREKSNGRKHHKVKAENLARGYYDRIHSDIRAGLQAEYDARIERAIVNGYPREWFYDDEGSI